MKSVKINTRKIGEHSPCFIIAEIGSNHDGSLRQAEQLIDIAAQVGCDAVKIQLPIADEAYPPGTKFGGIYGDLDISSIIKKNEVPVEWIPVLVDYAHAKGISIGASADGVIGLEMMLKSDIDFIKIPSFTISNIPLLNQAKKTKLPWLLSTGVHSIGAIEEALDAVRPAPVALLHCISAYPASPEDLNLNTIPFLKDAFDVPVGFSDHSLDPTSGPSLAVALGASIVEKHFTISRKLKGTDHFFALEPRELAEMVREVRHVENNPEYKKSLLTSAKNKPLLGHPRRGILGAEEEVHARTRLGLYFLESLKRGTKIMQHQIRVYRCADAKLGLHPRYADLVIGSRLLKGTTAFEPVTWSHVIDRDGE